MVHGRLSLGRRRTAHDVREEWERASLVVIAAACLLVLLLAIGVVTGFATTRWDARADLWMASHQNATLLRGAHLVSRTAQAWVGVVVVLVIGVVAAVWRRRWWPVAAAAAVAVVLVGSVYAGKVVVAHAHDAVGPSVDRDIGFPSGHAATAVVMAGTALVLLGGRLPRPLRRAAVVVLVLYAGVIGVSRLYIRVHVLSDVLGGWLLGIVIVLALALVEARRRLRAHG